MKITKSPRECASCGHLCEDAGEFHPFVFCAIKKASPSTVPWDQFKATLFLLGVDVSRYPRNPPLVRDLKAFATSLAEPSEENTDG